jgi:hypothetical protein
MLWCPRMKIKVAVRGVMLDSPKKEEFTPYIETRLKAKQPANDSSFVRGMVWGIAVSLIIWMLLTLAAIRWWL